MEINKLIHEAHQNAIDKGFYGEDGKEERNFGEIVALMHSELTEVLEEARAGNGPTETYYECTTDCFDCKYSPGEMMEKCPAVNSQTANLPHSVYSTGLVKPCGIPSEFADLLIRVFDTCGHYGIDLEGAIREKMEFNRTRPYKHGKKF